MAKNGDIQSHNVRVRNPIIACHRLGARYPLGWQVAMQPYILVDFIRRVCLQGMKAGNYVNGWCDRQGPG